jgi:multidrug resistance efflux pump
VAEEIETGVRPLADGVEPPPTTAPPSTNGASSDGTPPPEDGEGRVASNRFGRVNRRSFRRIVIPVVAVVAIIAVIIGVYTYVTSQWYVSTDNAQVDGTPVQVGSLNAGRVEAINVQVGSSVNKGDVLARVILPTQVGSALVREGISAPFDGTVIDVPVGVGATVQPGQGVVTMVDPNTLYVNANIDETSVRHVAIGDPVDVHLDALNETVTGTVESITPASAATFSLLPQNNSSGTFTKVTQLVPVKISIPVQDSRLTVGTSAEVKIHVAGH